VYEEVFGTEGVYVLRNVQERLCSSGHTFFSVNPTEEKILKTPVINRPADFYVYASIPPLSYVKKLLHCYLGVDKAEQSCVCLSYNSECLPN